MKTIFFSLLILSLSFTQVKADNFYIQLAYGRSNIQHSPTNKSQLAIVQSDSNYSYHQSIVDFGLYWSASEHLIMGYATSNVTDSYTHDLNSTDIVSLSYVLPAFSMLYFLEEAYEGLFIRCDLGPGFVTGNFLMDETHYLGTIFGLGYRYKYVAVSLNSHYLINEREDSSSVNATLGIFW